MSIKELIGSTFELIVKVVFLVFAATYIIRAATASYEYGYRVFTEQPISQGEGRTISVSVEEPASVKDIGRMLEERGLIRDANLFVIQELLSENHGKIRPGIYDLSTTMTAEEMLDVMSPEEEESAGTGESSDAPEESAGAGESSDAPEESGDADGEETPDTQEETP